MNGLCAVCGVLIGWHIVLFSGNDSYAFFPLPAALAAFVTSALSWKLLVERARNRATRWRAMLAGALSGSVAHYVCWVIVFAMANVCYHVFGNCKSSLNDPPAGSLDALKGAAGLTFLSLIFYGWITIPYGALAGLLIALRRDKRHLPSE